MLGESKLQKCGNGAHKDKKLAETDVIQVVQNGAYNIIYT